MKRAMVQIRRGESTGALFAVLATCLVCELFVWLAVDGRQKYAVLPLVLLAALYIPFLVDRGKRLWLAALPLAVFWVPGPLGLVAFGPVRALTLVEALVFLAIFAVAAGSLAAGKELEVGRLKAFPWAGFLVFFAGTAVTYLFAFRTGGELPILRIFVFLPFALGLLTMFAVQDAKDALKLLWVLVVAAAALGIVFMLGSRGIGPFSASTYVAAGGAERAGLSFSLPYLGSLDIDSQSAADKFAFMFAAAWLLLLTSASWQKRLAAGAAVVIFAAVVVTAQGRTGLLACLVTVILFTMWAVRRRSLDRVMALVAAGAAFGGVVGATVYLALHARNAFYASRILQLASTRQNDTTFAWRIVQWRRGLHYAVSHPEGVGLFAPPFGSMSTWATHNLWLFAALSMGWLGLAGLLLVFFRFGRVFIAGTRSADADGARLAALGLVLLANVVVIGMSEPLVWSSYSAVMVWMPMWIAFAGVVGCRHELLRPRA